MRFAIPFVPPLDLGFTWSCVGYSGGVSPAGARINGFGMGSPHSQQRPCCATYIRIFLFHRLLTPVLIFQLYVGSIRLMLAISDCTSNWNSQIRHVTDPG